MDDRIALLKYSEAFNATGSNDSYETRRKALLTKFTARYLEPIAEACHEANRVWQKAIGEDPSPAWNDAPEEQKKSARAGVLIHLTDGLTGDCCRHGSSSDGERSHNSWMKVKLEDGWRYGATKNSETKEHPCLLPYEFLPAVQKQKDHLFRGIVMSFCGAELANELTKAVDEETCNQEKKAG